MTKETKWILGLAAVVGGYLLLKNGVALPGLSSEADAPGVEPGDVKYSRYEKAWGEARKNGSPTFTLDGTQVFKESRERGWRFRYIYTFETPGGSFVSKTKKRVQ